MPIYIFVVLSVKVLVNLVNIFRNTCLVIGFNLDLMLSLEY
jgi:hypothetical protein